MLKLKTCKEKETVETGFRGHGNTLHRQGS